MLEFSVKFFCPEGKKFYRVLSKCRVYTEFADEIGSYLE